MISGEAVESHMIALKKILAPMPLICIKMIKCSH